jgi:hypothetical protein
MHLLTLVGLLAAHRGRAETTVFKWAGGHARLFARLNAGAGCNLHTAERVIAWFDQNWPADLEWPADVIRPSTLTKRRAA